MEPRGTGRTGILNISGLHDRAEDGPHHPGVPGPLRCGAGKKNIAETGSCDSDDREYKDG